VTKRATKNVRELELTYSALATAAMGNATALVVVEANEDRRELILTNVSDTTGYFAIGAATNLSLTVYALKLAAGETYVFDNLVPTQAIYGICGAGSKNIAYQEAT
jgi:hypothetical protein